METPDDYHEAAFISITLICDECRNCCLDSEDLPEGQPRFPDEGYFIALGDEAFRLGWHVCHNAAGDDLLTICPDCARRLGHGATESSGE